MADRRSFIRKSGALAALATGSGIGVKAVDCSFRNVSPRILPRRLKEGDLIGLVTPGSSVTREQLASCISKLAEMGFRTNYKKTVLSEYGYFAGRDRERADELMDMFTREEVDGIMCVRGGYGSIRILDLLDFDRIEKNPKAFIGYSDITALLTSVCKETGLVTFHGPVGISDFNGFSVRSLQKVILDPRKPISILTNARKRPGIIRNLIFIPSPVERLKAH